MRICVAHETVYRYDAPCAGVIQTLRLTPRNHAGQYVVSWRIGVAANCRLEPVADAFGNTVHTFSLAGPLTELRLTVDGEVETQDTAGVVRGAVERFPPSLFLRETALTRPDAAILAYAARFPRPDAAATLQTLHSVLSCIHQDFAADGGTAAADPAAAAETAPAALLATPAAADVFKAGRGHSRDLAHLFIAVARALGMPARFVAGYIRHGNGFSTQTGAAANAAAETAGAFADHMRTGMQMGDPHTEIPRTEDSWVGDSWVEAYVPGLGWVGFDPAHGMSPTGQYVRVATGLDYRGAAPMRGFHYGSAQEDVTVRLTVTQASRQPQE
jgi:transglutaminase-like putative cysteine protease